MQYRIGKMYAAGLGTEQDYTLAASWFNKAVEKNHNICKANTSLPLYSLAGLYYRGQGVEQSYTKAFELYEKSAMQGNAYASYELAKMLRDGVGCEQDTSKSNRHFETALIGFEIMEAERSDDKLQYRLGQMLRDGIGTEPNVVQARLYFESSSKLGNSNAQYALAMMIIQSGEAERRPEAIKWLTKSAGEKNPFAGYSLGKLYLDGVHVEKDIPKAVALFTMSAEQKNEFAQYQLGKVFLQGEDVPKDVSAAMRWLTASAEQNNEYAQYQIGKLYLLGRDVPRDREQAVYWLTLSAAQGNEYAQFFLDRIDQFQNGSLLSSATGLLRGLSKLFDEQQQQQTVKANHIDRKRMRELRAKQQAQGHAKDEQIQNY